jgi:DNA-binding transcriptional MerR regulator
VGQFAELSGVTVRTLRYHDQTGLLQPSGQTRGGHRVYDQQNVSRMYRIQALRRLGFRLAEIRALLDDPTWDLGTMVDRHITETEGTIATAARLSAHLRTIRAELARSQKTRSETLFTIMEEMTMLETPARDSTTLLVYDDVAAAHAYLARTFGLAPGALDHDAEGRAVHGELFAGDHAIWLHPAGEGLDSPRTLGATSSMTMISVDDVDEHHAHAVQQGAEIVESPVSQPYGIREYGARDLEGHMWYFQSPLER